MGIKTQKQESVTTEWSLVHAGRDEEGGSRFLPPSLLHLCRCIKESFSGCNQTPAAAHTEIFVTICRISCRKMETLLVLCLVLTLTSSSKENKRTFTFSSFHTFLWLFVWFTAAWSRKTQTKKLRSSQIREIKLSPSYRLRGTEKPGEGEEVGEGIKKPFHMFIVETIQTYSDDFMYIWCL